MRILVYTDDPGYGGTAVNTDILARGLAARGQEVVLASGGAPGRPPPGVERLDIGYDPMRLFEKSAVSLVEPRAVLAAARPDAVMFSDGSPGASLAAKEAAWEAGLPAVMVCNFAARSQVRGLARHLEAIHRAYRGAAAVVAVSRDNLDILRTSFGAPPETSRVIHYGRPEEFFRPVDPLVRAAWRGALGLAETDVLCLTAARYERRKGYHIQLAALSRLRDRPVFGRLRFAWAGHGQEADIAALKRAVRRAGLEATIAVLGERDDIRELLAASDIFVLPSEEEGMPLSIIEAMAAGLPVVATAVSGIPEQLGQTGALLPDPSRDAAATALALGEALSALALDPEAGRRLGRAARERAVALFSEDRMIDDYFRLLERLGPRRGASGRARSEAGALPVPTPGETATLGRGAAGLAYPRFGFSDAEDEGSWTDGPEARLALALPATVSGPFLLQFGLRPFRDIPGRVLTVRVVVNGIDRLTRVFDPAAESQARGLAIPLAFEGPSERLDIRVRIEGAMAPAEVGLSGETRRLGLFFTALRLEPLPPPTLLPEPLCPDYLAWLERRGPLPGREPSLPRFAARRLMDGRRRDGVPELFEHVLALADLPSTLPAAAGPTRPTMLMREVLESRPDVAGRFRLDLPEGLSGFVDWFYRYGAAEHGLLDHLGRDVSGWGTGGFCPSAPVGPSTPA